jgi:hypothetical protein
MCLLENVTEYFSGQDTNASKTFGRMATKLLQIRFFNATVVDALKEHHPVARLHSCSWFLQSVQVGEFDPQLLFFLMCPGFRYTEGRILRTTVLECGKSRTYPQTPFL